MFKESLRQELEVNFRVGTTILEAVAVLYSLQSFRWTRL